MLLQCNLNSSFFIESLTKGLVDLNIDDITLLEDDTVVWKLSIELCHHSIGHIWFQIQDLTEPNTVDEVTNVLLTLSCQQFIETSCTKMIDECLNLICNLRQSESEMNIHINVGVVLSWASLDWSIVVNNTLGKHASYSSVAAVTEVSTCIHDTLRLSTVLLQDHKIGWNIELEITAAASIASSYHHNDTFGVWIVATFLRRDLVCGIN